MVLDFSNAKLGEDAVQPIGVEDGLLKQIRTGQFNARTARVVLDLASVTGHHVEMLDDPPRVVVDIAGRRVPATRDRAEDGNVPTPAAPAHGAADAPPSAMLFPPAAVPTPAAKEHDARRPAAAAPSKPGAPGMTWQGGADAHAGEPTPATEGDRDAKASTGTEPKRDQAPQGQVAATESARAERAAPAHRPVADRPRSRPRRERSGRSGSTGSWRRTSPLPSRSVSSGVSRRGSRHRCC